MAAIYLNSFRIALPMAFPASECLALITQGRRANRQPMGGLLAQTGGSVIILVTVHSEPA